MKVPHTAPADYPVRPHTHFASTISTDEPTGCTVALLGIPDDTGVTMNAGRAGASQGPAEFRAALARYGAAEPTGFHWPRVFDAGDIRPAKTLEETHGRVTEAVAALLDAGMLPIAIGGGHDLSFPVIRAAAAKFGPPAIVYCDAHLDVREKPGSGMPFRWLVEECGARELHVHGLDCYANSSAHLQWFQAHGGRVDPFEPEDDWPAGELCFSFDLDVIDQAYAPGVSAPNATGWTSAEALRWCHAAGRCPRVRCLDIMELSPPNDRDQRTARLAARLFQAMLHGIAQRPSPSR